MVTHVRHIEVTGGVDCLPYGCVRVTHVGLERVEMMDELAKYAAVCTAIIVIWGAFSTAEERLNLRSLVKRHVRANTLSVWCWLKFATSQDRVQRHCAGSLAKRTHRDALDGKR